MYCCRYGQTSETDDGEFIYIGINMHWEPYVFGLPQMPKEKEWVRLFSTDASAKPEDDEKKISVPPRTIVVYGTRTLSLKKKKEMNHE